MTSNSTSLPPPPNADDDDDKTILSSAMNRLSLDHHLDLYTLNESKVDVYMHLQPKVTAKSVANVIDWLIKVHNVFNLTNETLYLTINIIDRFLAVETISFSELQCVGVAAMHIATKYIENRESDDVIEVHEFVGLCCGAYEHQYVLAMESRILVRLEWKLSVVTPYFFLTCFIKAAQEYPLETTMENMVYFYAELGLMNYETIRFCPSMEAAAAVYAARATLNKSHVWHKTLEKQTGFMEMQVLECAKMMVEFHLVAKDDKERTEIYKKYSSEKRDAVALYPPAKSLLAAAVIQSSV